MFLRRTAATMLVDAEMAVRSGSWIIARGLDPLPAMSRVELLLAAPSREDDLSDAVDGLHKVMGDAMMAGDLAIPGYETFEIADVYPKLPAYEAADPPAAANDAHDLKKAA